MAMMALQTFSSIQTILDIQTPVISQLEFLQMMVLKISHMHIILKPNLT